MLVLIHEIYEFKHKTKSTASVVDYNTELSIQIWKSYVVCEFVSGEDNYFR